MKRSYWGVITVILSMFIIMISICAVKIDAASLYTSYQASVYDTKKQGLALKQSASANSARRALIPENTTITIDSLSGTGWGHTIYNGISGWVALRYTKVVGECTTDEPTWGKITPRNYEIYNTDNEGLEHRTMPKVDCSTFGPVYDGIVVCADAIQGEWAHVNYNGNSGWLNLTFMRRTTKAVTQAQSTVSTQQDTVSTQQTVGNTQQAAGSTQQTVGNTQQAAGNTQQTTDSTPQVTGNNQQSEPSAKETAEQAQTIDFSEEVNTGITKDDISGSVNYVSGGAIVKNGSVINMLDNFFTDFLRNSKLTTYDYTNNTDQMQVLYYLTCYQRYDMNEIFIDRAAEKNTFGNTRQLSEELLIKSGVGVFNISGAAYNSFIVICKNSSSKYTYDNGVLEEKNIHDARVDYEYTINIYSITKQADGKTEVVFEDYAFPSSSGGQEKKTSDTRTDYKKAIIEIRTYNEIDYVSLYSLTDLADDQIPEEMKKAVSVNEANEDNKIYGRAVNAGDAGLEVKTSPDSGAEKLFSIENGEIVLVDAVSGDWGHIDAGFSGGWINLSNIEVLNRKYNTIIR